MKSRAADRAAGCVGGRAAGTAVNLSVVFLVRLTGKEAGMVVDSGAEVEHRVEQGVEERAWCYA